MGLGRSIGYVLFLLSISLGCAALDVRFYELDGFANCTEVPALVEDIKQVAVLVSGLDPTKTYKVAPAGGAVMYWPGNEEENYSHYAWTLALTPENCAMGTDELPPLCGSSNEYTCCWYSTDKLGGTPPLLHSSNATKAFEEVKNNEIFFRGQNNVWVWFEDDNCANNVGTLKFLIKEAY